MRLASLNPKLSATPPGFVAPYTHSLTFDCPKCAGHRISVNVRLGVECGPGAVWALKLPEVPTGDGWDGVTLSPSIQNNTHGRKPCGFHCSIVNGDVLP